MEAAGLFDDIAKTQKAADDANTRAARMSNDLAELRVEHELRLKNIDDLANELAMTRQHNQILSAQLEAADIKPSKFPTTPVLPTNEPAREGEGDEEKVSE